MTAGSRIASALAVASLLTGCSLTLEPTYYLSEPDAAGGHDANRDGSTQHDAHHDAGARDVIGIPFDVQRPDAVTNDAQSADGNTPVDARPDALPPMDAGSPCLDGMTRCGPTCTDISTDVDNCGGCGFACPPPPMGLGVVECIVGACFLVCAAPLAGCDTTTGPSCIRLGTDTDCSGCGDVCAAGSHCLPSTSGGPATNACTAGATCTAVGDPCCPGNVCVGASCVSGSCACGAPGEQCCAGSTCARGGRCAGMWGGSFCVTDHMGTTPGDQCATTTTISDCGSGATCTIDPTTLLGYCLY